MNDVYAPFTDFIQHRFTHFFFRCLSRLYAILIVLLGLILLQADALASVLTDSIGNKLLFETEKISLLPENQYLAVVEQSIPESFNGYNTIIKTSFKQLGLSPETDASLVIELRRSDTIIYWHGISLHDTSNKAFHHIQIPASHTRDAQLKVFIWNKQRASFQLHGFKLWLEQLELPSYMPEINSPIPQGIPEVLWQNRLYELVYFRDPGLFFMNDARGKPLAGPWIWHIESDRKNQTNNSTNNYSWKKKSIKKIASGAMVQLRSRMPGVRLRLNIITSDSSGKIMFEAQQKFRRKTTLFRSSLLLPFRDEVSEVFRKNSLLDSAKFQKEYYLAREGFRVGKHQRNLLLYHTPGLSSSQLNTSEKILSLNLEYAADHLLIHYPKKEDTSDFFVDRSASRFKRGQTSQNAFSLYIGVPVQPLARFMQLPNGFEAAIIWTEHADWTNIRTHRAVNFGHEKIKTAEQATGGFVKWNIPVTKSVFFDNPDSISNSEISRGVFNEKHATIKTDTAFRSLLDQLFQRGHELCLHTPEQYTSTPQAMSSALNFMKHHYQSSSWIDHGYNNGLRNNRENLVCDGLKSSSRWYAADLWKQYGIQYFWNASVEELRPFEGWGFDGQFIIPFPGFGDAFPDPVITKHPGIDGLLWSTTGTLEVPEDRLWEYYFHPARIAQLINFRSIWINHVYPAWADETKGFWTWDENHKIIAMPGFNKALERISIHHKNGHLLPITINEFLNYHTALDQIDYQLQSDGNLRLTNNSGQTIFGLSLIINARNVAVNGKKPPSKMIGNETVFWFDFAPHSTVIIAY